MGVYRRRHPTGTVRWYAKIVHRGHEIRSEDFPAKWQAQEADAAMQRSRAAGTLQRDYGKHRVPTLAEYAESYLRDRRQHDRPSTIANKRTHLGRLRAELGEDTLLDRIAPLDVQRVKRNLRARLAGATTNRHLATLSSLMRRAVEDGMIGTNPCAGVQRYRESAQAWTVITAEQYASLLQLADVDRNESIGLAVRIAWGTGMRIGEVIAIRGTDIDPHWHFGRGGILIPLSKNFEPRKISLTGELRPHVLPSAGQDRRLIPVSYYTINTAWRRVRAAAELQRLRLHDFRHTFATRALRRGVEPMDLMRHMGWKTIAMVGRYGHLVDADTVRVAAAFDD